MKYLNKTFSVGGPLKGVTDSEWAAIFAPQSSRRCVDCDELLPVSEYTTADEPPKQCQTCEDYWW